MCKYKERRGHPSLPPSPSRKSHMAINQEVIILATSRSAPWRKPPCFVHSFISTSHRISISPPASSQDTLISKRRHRFALGRLRSKHIPEIFCAPLNACGFKYLYRNSRSQIAWLVLPGALLQLSDWAISEFLIILDPWVFAFPNMAQLKQSPVSCPLESSSLMLQGLQNELKNFIYFLTFLNHKFISLVLSLPKIFLGLIRDCH